MFFTLYQAFETARKDFDESVDLFIKTFAPIPPPNPNDQWIAFLLDIASTGATAGLGNLVKRGMLHTI